jgi:hypothetical protein
MGDEGLKRLSTPGYCKGELVKIARPCLNELIDFPYFYKKVEK